MRAPLFVLAFGGVALVAGDARALDIEPVFPLDIAIATEPTNPADDAPPGGAPVVTAQWIDQEVALAEHILSGLGVHVGIAHTHVVPAANARVSSLAERDAFASRVVPNAINVFVVAEIADSAAPGVFRRGVTWQARGPAHARYILLASTAAVSSLAHELGHFFGIQPESQVKNNLMSYDRDDLLVFLDSSQSALVRAGARRMIAARTFALGWRATEH